jgi:VanZ family protein
VHSPAPGHIKLVVALAVTTGVYWLAMFIGTHLPIRTTPIGDPYSLDKLEHVAAFAVLTGLACGVGTAWGIVATARYLGAIILIACYGVFDEATQALVAYRQPSLMDWLADLSGAALGTTAFAMVAYFIAAHRRRAA